MPTSDPVLSEWNEERRLAGRNFACQRCGQRWNEADLVWQDGLYLCRAQCYEGNGGEIERTLERARASSLAADLSAKEMRPPKQAGWSDGLNIYGITDFSAKPLVITRGGASGSLTLTGFGFTGTDTIAYDDSNITNASVMTTDTQVSLSVQASGSAARGLHVLTYNGDRYLAVVDVR